MIGALDVTLLHGAWCDQHGMARTSEGICALDLYCVAGSLEHFRAGIATWLLPVSLATNTGYSFWPECSYFDGSPGGASMARSSAQDAISWVTSLAG